jgi:hypothetical protein
MRQSPIPAPPTCTRKQGLTDEDLHAVARILSGGIHRTVITLMPPCNVGMSRSRAIDTSVG